MAVILIIDDRPSNREHLATLLGYGGHRLLEAGDGAEGLAMALAEHPALVIADVLMPTMDGYEFVRQLRADPAIRRTPVIFCTAHYHEREAQVLATACGVGHILTKPCEPEEVLRTVEEALGVAPPPPTATEELDREHLRIITDKLSQKADELRRTNERLSALVDLGLQLGSERDPLRLLQGLCHAARDIIGARYAMVGVLTGDGSQLRYSFTSGMDQATAERLGEPRPGQGVLGEVLQKCRRLHNPGGDPSALGLDTAFPPIHSFLGAPILSPGRTYGWLCLIDKFGAEEFYPDDERLAVTLAAQVGRIYENGSLYADLLRHASDLSVEMHERKRAQEERDRFFTQSSNLLCLVGFDGTVRRLNPAWEKLGFEYAEVLGASFVEIVHPDDRDQTLTEIEALATGAAAISFENRCRCKDGHYKWVLWNASPFLDHSGFYATGQDITERKLAEEALKEREERIRLLLDSTAEAIYGIDLEGNCTFSNKACARLLGYTTPEQLTGKNMHVLKHHSRADGKPHPSSECPLNQAFERGEGAHVDNDVFWRADGTKFPVEYWSFPMRRQDKIIGAVVTFLDISERKKLEEQLRQAQKMEAIGRLAGGVAHDFNNLLTIINGYGGLLLSRLPATNPAVELIQEMVAAGDRAAALTRQLLAFSRKTILEPRVLDLKIVVADMDKMLRRVIGEDIQLITRAEPAVGAVKADLSHIEQVVLNMAVNSRDAMPQGGRLIIEVRNIDLDARYVSNHPEARPGPHVVLAVSDTGCGMDAAVLARVWEPFFTTKGEKGTGLGLATVYGIVKQSGGHVTVHSEVGRGTTFKVYLPRIEQRPTAGKSHPGSLLLPRGTETILLVEDEDGVRALTCHVLRACGYTILEAPDGAEAVKLGAEHQDEIDLVVTDVVMPRIGGREVADRLRAMCPGVKLLFLSGYTDDAMVRHGIHEAQVAFLQKPFSPASLAMKVREVLDGP